MYLKSQHVSQVTATVKGLSAGRLDEGRPRAGWWRSSKFAVGTYNAALRARSPL